MEEKELRVLKKIIEILNDATFKNIKAGQMLDKVATLKDFARIIAKYEKKLSEDIKVLDDPVVLSEGADAKSE